MPAHALSPQRGWLVMDCCAAPGNKTTHVAALLHAAGGGRCERGERGGGRKMTHVAALLHAAGGGRCEGGEGGGELEGTEGEALTWF